MMKINFLIKKEDIDHEKVDDSKIAVVLDILLATTTITASLDGGADYVIPVLDEHEARLEQKKYNSGETCLVGESGGVVIDGFMNPVPSLLCPHVAGKKVILSTTNGTVAIRAAAPAKTTYIASLLNSGAVASDLIENYQDETILVICSGSADQFCLEDFYGAGYFITQLLEMAGGDTVDMTDSARAAALFYEGYSHQEVDILSESKVGHMLIKAGFTDDIHFTCKKDTVDLVPVLTGDRITDKIKGGE